MKSQHGSTQSGGGAGSEFTAIWLHSEAYRESAKQGSAPGCVTPQILRHKFASIANDLGFSEVAIAALIGHSKGSVTSKYIHALDTTLLMAADTIAGYIQGLLDGVEFQQTAYSLDRSSRRAALTRLLARARGERDAGANSIDI